MPSHSRSLWSRIRGKKNARPRVHIPQFFPVLLVLPGWAPVPVRPLNWCFFVLAPVLYSSGAFAIVMGVAVAARPWFKVLWLNLRQDLLQAGGPACNHFGPTANKKVYAQCANKVRARSIYLHCRCHFSSPGPGPGFVLGVRPVVPDLSAHAGLIPKCC